MLVFPYIDEDCGELQDACNRLEMHTYIAHSSSDAIESFQHMTNGGHNLIIVDGRSPHLLDPETVARYASYVVGYNLIQICTLDNLSLLIFAPCQYMPIE